jgi:hypothetical protein
MMKLDDLGYPVTHGPRSPLRITWDESDFFHGKWWIGCMKHGGVSGMMLQPSNMVDLTIKYIKTMVF